MAPSFANRPSSPAHRLRLAGGTVGGSVELSVIVVLKESISLNETNYRLETTGVHATVLTVEAGQ